MHNDRMRLPSRPSGRLPGLLVGVTVALAVVLTGCGADGQTPDGDADPTGTPSAEPYLPVPEGVELTPQGSELAVGDTATVAFELSQGEVGAMDITVTSLEKANFDLFVGWELTKEIRKTAPYFVRAKVTNVGETDLGSKQAPRPVPLYAVDGENRLIESSLFTGSFKPCDGATFPKRFRTGATLDACMVYLAPGRGDLAAASFRPSQEFDPIVWTGKLVPADDGKGKGKGEGDGKNDDQGKQDGQGKQGGQGDN